VAGRELRVYTDEESIAGGRRVFQDQWSGE
jgi:hypothetical protein